MVQDTYKRVWTNGTTAYVTVPSHASLLPHADYITLEARVYIDINQNYGRMGGILTKSNTASDNLGYAITYDDRQSIGRTRRLEFNIYHAVGDIGNMPVQNAITESGWYHIVATYDRTLGSDNMKLFLNGVRIGVANYAQTITYNAVRDVEVGAFSLGIFPLWAYFAQAGIYNRALTEAEINYNYLHPNNPKRQGLVMSLVQTSIDKPAAGTWRDVSPQTGNNGTITNATTSKYPAISAGRNALFFPTAAGTNSVNCGNGASLQISGTISMEIFVKLAEISPQACIIFGRKFNATGWEWGFNYPSRQIYLFSDTGYCVTSVTGLNLRSWSHIVVTHTPGAATAKVYVNGIDKTAAQAVRPLTDPAASLYVSSSISYAPIGGYCVGFHLYNRILTPEEVAYNYRHPNNPKRRGLVLNLSQESLYGTQWQDLSGNANHGTITGAIAKNIADSLTGD